MYDVIIPIYNGFEYLNTLFTSLQLGTTTPHRLILINDCSTDLRIISFLKNIDRYKNKDCLAIIVVHNTHNLGFTTTINKAYALTQHPIVILNTDTEVPNDWLNRLFYPMIKDPSIASVTPLTNSGTICSFPQWLQDNELIFNLSLKQIDDVFKTINNQNYIEAPTGVGFCMALNRKVIEEIGLFDEKNFPRGYGEENDWCMRAKSAGYKNILIQNLFVYHKHGGSFGIEKESLVKSNSIKLQKKYPSYETEIKYFINGRPLEHSYTKAILKLFLLFKPSIILSHFWDGGSTHFVDEHLLSHNKHHYHILILGTGRHVKNNIKLMHHQTCLYTLTINDLNTILDLLNNENCEFFHINHVIHLDNLPDNIQALINFFITNKIKPIYYLHDYFLICPTINLINKNKEFCGIPKNEETCNECLKNNHRFIHIPLPKHLSILDWRTQMHALLKTCSAIYSFSNASTKLLVQAYPDLNSMIVPYTLNLRKLEKIIEYPNFEAKKNLTIGVLGKIDEIKGFGIVQDIARLIKKSSIPFKITVLGSVYKRIPNTTLVGPYKKIDLPKLCKELNIDLFILPSITPETYCYTADEIMNMGYPLLCFNLGAPAERVKNYKEGWIVYDLTAPALLKGIIDCSKRYGFIHMKSYKKTTLLDRIKKIAFLV